MSLPLMVDVVVVWLLVVVVELVSGVCDVLLGVWVCVLLVSGVVVCDEGEVLLGLAGWELLVSGVVDCGVVGELLCATTQTAESSRIAGIRDSFLIYILLNYFSASSSGLKHFGSGVNLLDILWQRGFASVAPLRKE